MSNCSQLPLWVSYSQALAVPFIAVIGAWIAARQMLIAHDKLQLDAFDRHYARRVVVYEATRKILAKVYENISEDDIRHYTLYTLDAEFLFDDEMWKYLNQLRNCIDTVRLAKSKIDLSSGDEKDEWKRIERENLNWILQQGDDRSGFSVRFRPFLVYKRPKRAWLLRWPCEE